MSFASENPKKNIPTIFKPNTLTTVHQCVNLQAWGFSAHLGSVTARRSRSSDNFIQIRLKTSFITQLYNEKKTFSSLLCLPSSVSHFFLSESEKLSVSHCFAHPNRDTGVQNVPKDLNVFFSLYLGYVNLRFSPIWIVLFQSRDRCALMQPQNVTVFGGSRSESHYRLDRAAGHARIGDWFLVGTWVGNTLKKMLTEKFSGRAF